MKLINLITLYTIFVSCCIGPSIAAVQCRSYGQQLGQCVELRKCPPLLAVILSNEKTKDDIRILQQLTCLAESTSRNDPFVCCPLGEIVSSSYIPKEVLQSERTPSQATSDSPNAGRISPTLAPPSAPSFGVFPTRRKTTVATVRPSSSANQSGPRVTSSVTAAEDRLSRRKFLSLMPSLDNCSLSDVTGGRIIGGNETEHGQYPYMARLGYRNVKTNKVEYYCGGVIISSRYILTAAHCTYGYDDNFELAHVRLGEHNTKVLTDCSVELASCSVPENIPVEKVITHPDYNTVTKHNDIALVRVNRDIGFQTYFIKPVCLPFMKEYGLPEPKNLNYLNAIVAGWGRTNWTRSEGSSVLQHVTLPIVATDKCIRDFRNRVKITPEQLCAGGERNQDSCGGDSGGPLLIDIEIGKAGGFPIKRKFQYGIVSFGPVKCGIGVAGVYTYVPKYLSWILKNIEP